MRLPLWLIAVGLLFLSFLVYLFFTPSRSLLLSFFSASSSSYTHTHTHIYIFFCVDIYIYINIDT